MKKELSLFSYQSKAVKRWSENGHRLLLEMATGTGKTRTAIGCMKKCVDAKSPMIFIISCPYSNLARQWKHEIDALDISIDADLVCDSSNAKWKPMLSNVLNKMLIGWYQTFVIYTTHKTCSSADFIDKISEIKKDIPVFFIGDEVHGLGARQAQKGLLDWYEYRLGLSATPSRWFDETGTMLITDYFGNDTFEFSVHDAQSNINPLTGKPFLVNYFYYPKFVRLNDDELERYKKLSDKIVKMMNEPLKSEDEHECLQNLMFIRANIEKNAVEKYNALSEILSKMGPSIKNTIIFVSSEQIDTVMDMLNQYHVSAHRFTQEESVLPDDKYDGLSEREYIIKQFIEGSYRVLVAIKCLDEGIDIPSAETAIVMASSTNPREYIQRIGRVIRQSPGKQNATIYDFILHPQLECDSALYNTEYRIFRKEMVRVTELSQNALNNAVVLQQVYKELGD